MVIVHMDYIKAAKILSMGFTRKVVDYKLVAVARGQVLAYQLLFFCNLVNYLLLLYKIHLIFLELGAHKLKLINFDWIHLNLKSRRYSLLVNQFLWLMLRMYQKFILVSILKFLKVSHLILSQFILRILYVAIFNRST